MKLSNISSKAIEYLFYALFFLVPLVFLGSTSELFELNKIWLMYGIAILIALFWGIKSVANKRLEVRRTPLDLPILAFLIANVLATIISWDPYVSFWGYYSRFNGGLLSTITFVFLYFAFVSNFSDRIRTVIRNILGVSLLSGLVVSLWGLPSHFGYDPTCLVFRKTLDVSCWTADFQPRIRIFSTLGQPAWLAAYLAVLLPIALGYAISKRNALVEIFERINLPRAETLSFIAFGALSSLFFVDILYTRARAGIIATLLALAFFVLGIYLLNRAPFKKFFVSYKRLWIIFLAFIVLGFLVQVPLPVVEKISLDNLKQVAQKSEAPKETSNTPEMPHAVALGGTDSGQIRAIVWRGAIDTWKANPILGTGVETFAYSYYQYRPEAHNRTSEWNFLYNKAHNEYLNYLATTGIVGFLSYMFFIVVFILRTKKAALDSMGFNLSVFNRLPKTSSQTVKEFKDPINFALLPAFFTILVTNFFGFSVVIINLYFFLIPLFFLGLVYMLSDKSLGKSFGKTEESLSSVQKIFMVVLTLVALVLLYFLARHWIADKNYALGSNLARAGQYQEAYTYLQRAVALRPEPVFKDELSLSSGIMAAFLISQPQASTESANLAQSMTSEALGISDELTQKYPKNIVYWKSRVRLLYNLAQVDPRYLPEAVKAMEKVHELAPTEASISYNLGVLYGQNGDTDKAVKELERTVKLKPDYRDAWYALGIFYHEQAIDQSGRVVNAGIQKKAEDSLNFILKNINVDDEAALQTLQSWQ